MKFQLAGEQGILEGFKELVQERGGGISEDGILIEAVRHEKNEIIVSWKDNKGVIYYKDTVHFFRGFGLLMAHIKEEQWNTNETVFFTENGAMFDCSRNGVLLTESIKAYIRILAVLGMNELMLYTEDTFELGEYPYFGAMRGRYTKEELKECDDYAKLFGIALIPCIQTLAHLKTFLRWPANEAYKDTDEILLSGDEKVYQLIEAMIKQISSFVSSKKIHLGMDEAHSLGLGKYLQQNGVVNRFEIMEQHLSRVTGICKKYGLEPMIWSDMYFNLAAPTGWYYDVPENYEFKENQKPPKGTAVVYWDYYHEEESFYESYLKLHYKLSDDVYFAAGGWTWNGLAPNYSKGSKTMTSALNACKKSGLQKVFCTLWQDNGAETPLITGIPMLILFAEQGFHDTITKELWAERFQTLTGAELDDFLLLDSFDGVHGFDVCNSNGENPSKFLYYQDVLLGLFDKQIEGMGFTGYYQKLWNRMKQILEKDEKFKDLFSYYAVLAELLYKKSELGILLYQAYQQKDKKRLKELADSILTDCIALSEELIEKREELWFKECKPNGFEVLDIRMGGVAQRLRSARKRILSYTEGRVFSLPELEEQRLLYQKKETGQSLCSCNFWEKIITPGNVWGV